jgi:hypothetical protein
LIIGSCTQQEVKSQIEGAWRLVYAQWGSDGGNFPTTVKGSDIKIWAKEYFASVGHLVESDTIITDAFVGGTYTLEGNKYTETVMYHANKEFLGIKVKLLLEIRNDTLIQSYPADDNWNLQVGYSIEKYVRAE